MCELQKIKNPPFFFWFNMWTFHRVLPTCHHGKWTNSGLGLGFRPRPRPGPESGTEDSRGLPEEGERDAWAGNLAVRSKTACWRVKLIIFLRWSNMNQYCTINMNMNQTYVLIDPHENMNKHESKWINMNQYKSISKLLWEWWVGCTVDGHESNVARWIWLILRSSELRKGGQGSIGWRYDWSEDWKGGSTIF